MDLSAIESVAGELPTGMTLVFIALLVLGLIVWLLGRVLAKPACVLSGLALGGAMGLAGSHFIDQSATASFAFAVAGAIAGALLAAMLFRLWVAAVGALLLALIVPAGLVVWEGTPPPPMQTAAAATSDESAEGESPDAAKDAADEEDAAAATSFDKPRGEGASEEESADGEPPAEEDETSQWRQYLASLQAAGDALQGLYDKQAASIEQWWDELDDQTRQRIYYGSAVGALIGLLLGVIAPYTAAALESAVAGAMLLFFPGMRLIQHSMDQPPEWLPESPRATLLWLGLITIVGFALQWTLARQNTKK